MLEVGNMSPDRYTTNLRRTYVFTDQRLWRNPRLSPMSSNSVEIGIITFSRLFNSRRTMFRVYNE